MDGLKDIIKLRNILMRNKTESRGKIHFGMFPHVAQVEKKMVMMKWTENVRNWFLPFGIPLVMDTRDNVGISRKYVGYAIGEDLFVHKWLYDKYLGNLTSEILYTPITDYSATLARGGWLKDDKDKYENLLWRLSIRSSGHDFQKISQIHFEAKANIDRNLLYRDGWVVSRVLGNNAFYGIWTGPAMEQGGSRVLWYNQYLVILDLTEGTGVRVEGSMRFGRNPHPHVNGDMRLCEGGYSPIIHNHMNRGEITEFFMQMKNFLRQYNPSSPYFHLPLSRSDANTLRGHGAKFFKTKMYLR